MTSIQEFEGKNIEKAIEVACSALNVSKDKLQYKVISHGSTGIFGLVGMKKAKIGVTLPKPKNANGKRKPEIPPKVVKSTDSGTLSENSHLNEPDEATAAPSETRSLDKTVKPEFTRDEIRDSGLKALKTIVDSITEDTEIAVSEKQGRFLYEVSGGNSALLIGKRGQTLDAIQYLVEKIVNQANAKRSRITIDVEGYLQNRKANLKEMALKMAEKTKQTGKPSTIGQMNAHDRRIVHLALKDDNAIRTQSMGSGVIRKLVIFPRKPNPKQNKGD